MEKALHKREATHRTKRSAKPKPLLVDRGEFIQIADYVSSVVCARWTELIKKDAAHWTPAHQRGWMLGLAWYVMIEKGLLHQYHAEARKHNARIERLPHFLDAMRSASRYLVGPRGETGLPTRSRCENLGDHWSLAGFHINKTFSGGVPHGDFEGLSPYPDALFDSSTRAYSAVLSVSVPEQGGGLRIWKKRQLGNQKPKLDPSLAIDLQYPVGALTLFDSFLYHQVRPAVTRKNLRITGVIHFLFRSLPTPHWEYWF